MQKALTFTLVPLLITLFWVGCQNKNTAEIQKLEARYNEDASVALADSLVHLYRLSVKEDPNNHAQNLIYLTRAADIRFTKTGDAVTASRWLDDAIKNHSEGQDLAETMGVYALIWNAYLYKKIPALSLDPADVNNMRFHLDKNLQWLDSCVVRLEKKLGTPTSLDKSSAWKYIDICEAYVDRITKKQPERSVDLLMKAAGLAKTIENPNKAIQLYNYIVDKMPNHAKAPTAMFMTGFIYENDLGNVEKARAVYEGFLIKYPNDPDFTDDAQMALKLLGKSPEEIIKSFEKAPQ
ncbi:MAG: hypothetical protein IT270_18515 [Saprospiraceae bacterium]|nr:hypothetical protein [Saprospiraceae bacterium]